MDENKLLYFVAEKSDSFIIFFEFLTHKETKTLINVILATKMENHLQNKKFNAAYGWHLEMTNNVGQE